MLEELGVATHRFWAGEVMRIEGGRWGVVDGLLNIIISYHVGYWKYVRKW